MPRWKIGKVTVTRVVEWEMILDPASLLTGVTRDDLKAIPWLVPDYIDDEGGIRMSFHALLVEAPGMRLVVDTCIGQEALRNFPPSPNPLAPFLEQMAMSGFTRENVDAVICTHMHFDHVGWNTMLEDEKWVPTFPNARYLFGRSEYEHWQSAPSGHGSAHEAILAQSVRPVFDAGLATLVESNYRLSREIRLTPTPGHTPGHVSVVIESEDQSAFITGDMIHHPAQIAHPEWVGPADGDGALVLETRRRMLTRYADTPDLVIGTHFAQPTAGQIVRSGSSYRFEGCPSEPVRSSADLQAAVDR